MRCAGCLNQQSALQMHRMIRGYCGICVERIGDAALAEGWAVEGGAVTKPCLEIWHYSQDEPDKSHPKSSICKGTGRVKAGEAK